VKVETEWQQFERPLRRLDQKKQFAFATFSCSRAVKYYTQYCANDNCADPGLADEVLQSAWRFLESSKAEGQPEQLRKRLAKVSDGLADSETSLGIAAQEACFACMVLLEMLSGDLSTAHAMRVCGFVRDITDMLVQEQPDFGHVEEELETSILEHALMATELRLHQRALEIVSSRDGEDMVILLKQLA